MSVAQSEPESPEYPFLKGFFTRLNQAGIRYAVMRNYDTLPYSSGGSDVDILVHPKEEELVMAALTEAIKEAGGVAIGNSKSVGFVKVFSFGRARNGIDEWWGLRFDVSIGLSYAGVAKLIDNDFLNKWIHLHNGIRVLPGDLAAVLGVIKELLHNKLLPVRYLSVAADAVENNWAQLCNDLAPMGKPALVLLRELCLSDPQSPDIQAKSRDLRRLVLHTAFLQAPLAYLLKRCLYQWSKVKRLVTPPGLMLAILGTDGAGKSTVISAIEPILTAATHGAFTVRHLRPGLLPPLARLKGKREKQNGPVKDPHGSVPSGRGVSLLRLLYLMVDYVLGYWLMVRPKIAKSPAIFLFDRYVYDISLDSRRFRIGLPGRLIRWFTWFAPKPDIIFCLHGDPEMIAARKQELPVEEVTRQVEQLRRFAKHEPRAVLVSTEGTVEAARDQVLTVLQDYCELRSKR